jgi:hypothetical protein
MAIPSMASLELTMWRPSPQKPDIAEGSPAPEDGKDFSSAESFNTMFRIDSKADHGSEVLASTNNGGCAFEGGLTHRLAANGAPRTIELKHKITTSTMTEAGLSLRLTMWRPTPQKPDAANAGEPVETYDAYFMLGQASAGCDIELKPCAKNNCTFTSRLVQLAYSAAARILELTVTVKLT